MCTSFIKQIHYHLKFYHFVSVIQAQATATLIFNLIFFYNIKHLEKSSPPYYTYIYER